MIINVLPDFSRTVVTHSPMLLGDLKKKGMGTAEDRMSVFSTVINTTCLIPALKVFLDLDKYCLFIFC